MKNILRLLLVLFVLSLGFALYSYYPRLDIITGFASKGMASGVFLADRDQGDMEAEDLGFSPVNLAKNKIDEQNASVHSTIYGLKGRTAVYIEGLGAILTNDQSDGSDLLVPNRFASNDSLRFPYGSLAPKDSTFQNIDYGQLSKALESAFDKGEEKEKRSRSLLVVYKDHIVGERYAGALDEEALVLGWSMTKSIASTMYGIMAKKGMLDLHQKTGLTAWQNDERKDITIHNLLQMNSGLAWEEDYSTISDVTEMLFLASDMGAVQVKKTLSGAPNQTWNYSSGTTNLLSGPLMKTFFEDQQSYLDFWYKELIDKIGMHSMVVETDLSGSYVGSSYGWANTRDWAKFGLLYLHRGNWNGEQILDPEWVDYVAEPTPGSEGRYGAQFWLNAGGHYPDVPKDLFSCNGYQGQFVFIIPSKDLVVVRTGLMEEPEFDNNALLRDIIESIKD